MLRIFVTTHKVSVGGSTGVMFIFVFWSAVAGPIDKGGSRISARAWNPSCMLQLSSIFQWISFFYK